MGVNHKYFISNPSISLLFVTLLLGFKRTATVSDATGVD
jgi:hypothetical protein